MEQVPVFPDYPPTIPNVIADATRRFAEREFLVDGTLRLTYREADESAAELARGLLALGIGKASRVALVLPDNSDWVLAFMAAARIGALALPFSTLFQARELDWALKEADINTLLIASRYLGKDYLERLERAVPGLKDQKGTRLYIPSHPHLRHVVVWGECDRPWAIKGEEALRQLARDTPAIDAAFLRNVEAQVTPADLLMGICTSGSTSTPKIVIHTHGSTVRITHAMRVTFMGMEGSDRNFCGMPFFWLGGLNSNLMPAIYEGACMVFSDSQATADIFELMQREKITRVMMWPTQYKPLMELAASKGVDITPLIPHFRFQGPDGKTIPQERRAISLLGMTECFGSHGLGTLNEDLTEKHGASHGRSMRGMERKIVDPVTREELPPRQWGELKIRGFAMMDCYYKRERADVYGPDGWFFTGDTCAIDEEGYIYFRGRESDMIKTAGANVSPLEVENVMITYPGVSEAIVLGVPDESRGERVIAAIVPQEGASVDVEDVRSRLRADISSYKVPKEMFVMRFDEIPRSGAGKAQRRELKALLAERIRGAS